MSNELTEKIVNLIKINGPITVDRYFLLCLSDHEFGYYNTCNPFGSSGDFITAPEISQIFGEMLAIFLISSWEKHGSPNSVRLIEMGPGRGTMMLDIIRVIRKLKPYFFSALSIHFVENSKRLRFIQKQKLSSFIDKISWHFDLNDVPNGFTFIIANEFFDSLPIKQFIIRKDGIRERAIDIDSNQCLVFSEIDLEIEDNFISFCDYDYGSIFEVSPFRDDAMRSVSNRLVLEGGTALIIDYGHLQSGIGDTMQAIKDHKYDHPLMNPGMADLSSHVDFQRLSSVAKLHKLYINGCTTQRKFLEGLGIWQRMLSFMSNSAQSTDVLDSVLRLMGKNHDRKSMGELFKVLAISHEKIDLIPFIFD
ncbi:class I SAM-dependent methyltransferase [Candidatus Liberibacter americanus]|uniref:SAM-dependent methyltransferase n=1 Tax=Candidatus Liberibacter americanus str. Sao Paulo TaxID=1261131 RepID=U6B2Y0_9HYPH|nr:SAM-dependent methyltransferase [Candidatus Liberibacter americanus]AHA27419.1 hypothetical protein lam_035 [Candidatus Liberibacter americanus str. Sao Paulo]EMS36692.1 hypothetical protein G653_00555 [Candidatus Liberibacter americanus PW_SP]